MQSLFTIGQIMHHRLFGYRGVIYDVDPEFSGTQQWYEEMARSRPPRDRPWYHVLVDGAEHTTYVAERNLEPDAVQEPVRHPLLEHFFVRLEDGVYVTRSNLQ